MEYDFVIADRLGTHKCRTGVFLCPGGKENSLIGHIHSVESMGLVDGPGVRAEVFLQGCPCGAGIATTQTPRRAAARWSRQRN